MQRTQVKKGIWMRMTAVILAGILVLLCAGCGPDSSVSYLGEKETHIVVDAVGREVAVPAEVESILAIPWPWASHVFALDGNGDRIASMAATALKSYEDGMFRRLAPGLENSDTRYISDGNKDGGTFGTMNIEEIVKMHPDVVLIYDRDMGTMLERLEAVGIPTVVIGFGGFQEEQEGLRILGEVLGEQASKNAAYIIRQQQDVEKEISERTAKIPQGKKRKVLHLYSSDLTAMTAGFNGKVLKDAGLINVVTEDTDGDNVKEVINFEQILAWDPDIILLGNFDAFTPDDIYENKLAGQNWSTISAVKNRRVYKIPMGLYRWDAPNTEAHLELEWLAKLAYPEYFTDIDLQADTATFYKTLFDYDLTAEDFSLIYHDALNAHSKEVART